MLERAPLLLISGLLLLLLVSVITTLIRWAYTGMPSFRGQQRRIRMNRSCMPLLERCLRLPSDTADLKALHACSRSLAESLLLGQKRRSADSPANKSDPARMHALLESLSGAAQTTESIKRCLATWKSDDLSEADCTSLPNALGAHLSDALCHALRTISADALERSRGRRLAARLMRGRRTQAILARTRIGLVHTAETLSTLREHKQHEQTEAVDRWLQEQHSSAREVAALLTQRQTMLAREILHINDAFLALRRMDWQAAAEGLSPLHPLFVHDPAGLYPQMTIAARASLRLQADKLSARLRVSAIALIKAALVLSSQAEKNSLEQYLGYYITEPEGVSLLRRELHVRRGRLIAFGMRHRTAIVRCVLWAFSIFVSWRILPDPLPLILIPAYFVVAGSPARLIMQWMYRRRTVPDIQADDARRAVRTLVVMPSVLRTGSDAVRCFRALRTMRHAFPEKDTDLLLIGDYPQNLSMSVVADQEIMTAGAHCAAVLNSEDASCRYLYLQRQRAWDQHRHTFGARCGSTGAVESICRLIHSGSCRDAFDFCTEPLSFLYRHYDFILTVTPDVLPLPGMLSALLNAACHPANTRIDTPSGVRGFSVFLPQIVFKDAAEASAAHSSLLRPVTTALIVPQAYLEATEHVLDRSQPEHSFLLESMVSGACTVEDAEGIISAPPEPADGIQRISDMQKLWHMLRWSFPWVQTPSGFIANPVSPTDRLRLREKLRTAIVPLCRMLLFAWALLSGFPVLAAAALLVPGPDLAVPTARAGVKSLVQQIALLPYHAALSAYAIGSALLAMVQKKESASCPGTDSTWKLSAQAGGILLCLAASVAADVIPIPAWLMAALFLWPIAAEFLQKSVEKPLQPTNNELDFLQEAGQTTWQFFLMALEAHPSGLPPAQFSGASTDDFSSFTTPEAIAMSLVAIVSACEMQLINRSDAAVRLTRLAEAVSALPYPNGVPCRRYNLHDGTPADLSADAWSAGLLLASLMTAAQAVRTWLPDLPPAHHGLCAALDAQAERIRTERLFDSSSGLFHASLDSNGQGCGHVLHFSDAALLLSIVSCARRAVPPAHFSRLIRTRIEIDGECLPCSSAGSLSDCLLPVLFTVIPDTGADQLIWHEQRRGSGGIWGRDRCAELPFRNEGCTSTTFGLPETAVKAVDGRAVFTPWATALALTCAPAAACQCLMNMQQHGMMGPFGFYEAIDFTRESHPVVVHIYDTFHQGAILGAAAHLLANGAVRRFFMGIPSVEACVPLLAFQQSAPLLPQMPLAAPVQHLPVREAGTTASPQDAHLIGNAETFAAVNARGSCMLSLRRRRITTFEGCPGEAEGIQFFAQIDSEVFRLTDPQLPGRTIFLPGQAIFERQMGRIRSSLRITADTVNRQILHMVEIVNMSEDTADVILSDVLIPDFQADPTSLEAPSSHHGHAVLHVSGTEMTLHHCVTCSLSTTSPELCTDHPGFPASEQHLSTAEYLSFRVQLTLPPHAREVLLYSTGLQEGCYYSEKDADAAFDLAVLQAEASANSALLTEETYVTACRLCGLLLWHEDQTETSCVTFICSSSGCLPVLRQCISCTAWLSMSGIPVQLQVLCSDSLTGAVERELSGSLLASDNFRVYADPDDAQKDTLLRASLITLYGDRGTLLQQINRAADNLESKAE